MDRPEDILGNTKSWWNNSSKSISKENEEQSFFNRLRLEVDRELVKEIFNITVNPDRKPTEPEYFQSCIWSIRIKNKNPFSKMTRDCVPTLYIKDVTSGINFRWRTDVPFPNICKLSDVIPSIGLTIRQQYIKLLAYYYVIEGLLDTTRPQVDIYKGRSHHFYFIFTFKDSNYAFFILVFVSKTFL